MAAASPLAGIKVLEMSSAAAGPLIGRCLADWGATVVRVESHLRPDLVRANGPYRDDIPDIDGSSEFADFNSSKLSVSLDISHPESRPVLARLLAWADVVIENYRPGVADRLGFGYEASRRQRPDVVYCSTSMQGATGPLSAAAGFGNQVGALAGISEITGWPDRLPSYPFGAVTDFFAPRVATFAVLAALDHRRRTGEGQYLDQSQLETSLLLIAPACVDFAVNGRIAHRSGNRTADAAPHGVFRCDGDDRWCAISVFSDAEWLALCEAAEKPEWARDPRFSSLSSRKHHEDELEELLGSWTGALSPREVTSRLQSVGVSAGPVEDARDLLEWDPQLRHRGHFRRLEHPVIGVHAYNAPAFRLSGVADNQSAGPCLGQHNALVLCDLLGMGEEEVRRLGEAGVLTAKTDLPQTP